MVKREVSAWAGIVQGRNRLELFVCQFSDMTNSKGCIWTGGSPFAFSLPLVLAQLIFIFFVTRIIFGLLQPLKQSMVSAQLIVSSFFSSQFSYTCVAKFMLSKWIQDLNLTS